MKYFIGILSALLFISCASTQIVNNWKNPDVETIVISKVLIVGMTSDLDARVAYENNLKIEFEKRGIEAIKSLDLFKPDFTTEEKTKAELDSIETILVGEGFDAILFTKVVGVEDKIAYSKTFNNDENTYRKFKEEYLMYQDVYYNPEYYTEYTVYHTETSLFCICPTKARELAWKGYIDITEPESTEKAINEYVRLVILVLEDQQILSVVN